MNSTPDPNGSRENPELHDLKLSPADERLLDALMDSGFDPAALEATFEVMQTGYCDENWAREHHDLWYAEVKGEAVAPTADEPEPAKSTDTA